MTIFCGILVYWVVCYVGICLVRKARCKFSNKTGKNMPLAKQVVRALVAPIAFPAMMFIAPFLISQNWASIEPRLIEILTELAQE